MTGTRSTCCYCGTGCGVVIHSEGGQVVGVSGDEAHPSSRGRLCTKGSTLHLTMTPGAMTARARWPEMRRNLDPGLRRDDRRERVSWDEALDHVADRFAACIREHGPDSVAFYVSGQLLTEDYAVFNKLAKGLVGTANIDTNSRLCMSSAVAGYTKTLGVDAPPACYDDIDVAECLFIAGSNTAFAHPVLYRRIEAARERNPGLKVIVVDPRRTQTARFADLHLAIAPGTDVALFHGMLHVMLWERLVDEAWIDAHTTGFHALRTLVREYTPKATAGICGVRAEDIEAAARWFARSKATLSLYCQGLNQSSSGTGKNAALINLHLATGHIGREGAGPFSLTGQPNAMGGREVGGLATTLAAHREFGDAAGREEIAKLWNVASVPEARGLTAVEMFDALRDGRVKMIWIACTNPAQSLPDLPNVEAALRAAELVVLQEAYANTETAAFADVLLPAASWGEKEGTVTNSERRISRVRAAVPPPGEARADWEIAADFARRLQARLDPGLRRDDDGGGRHPGEGRGPSFDYISPEEVWNEHREATRGRDLDITGLSYAILERDGPQQWPYPEAATSGTARLYTDGRFPTPDGRARFFVEAHRAPADRVDAHFPLRLTTTRLRDHWHAQSRTGTVARLYGHTPEPRLGLNAADMARRGWRDGELVNVRSRRGNVYVIAQADDEVASGQASLPMHWGARFLGGTASRGTNTLTSPALDPHSRQPELKFAAVKVEPAALPWRLVAFAHGSEAQRVAWMDAFQALFSDVAFASAVPFDGEAGGVLLRAAAAGSPGDAWLARLDALLGLAGDDALRYDDPRRARGRRLRIDADRLGAARLCGDEAAVGSGEWLLEWLASARDVRSVRAALLTGAPMPPSAIAPRGRTVCQCHGVPEGLIVATMAAAGPDASARLAAAQAAHGCGTSCGSCLPELRELALREPGRAERAA